MRDPHDTAALERLFGFARGGWSPSIGGGAEGGMARGAGVAFLFGSGFCAGNTGTDGTRPSAEAGEDARVTAFAKKAGHAARDYRRPAGMTAPGPRYTLLP